jgi:tetratricopeptide (TPR) repeat protein
MGGLVALEGRFDEARGFLDGATATYEEIGDTYALANNSGRIVGEIEQLAGDPGSAERALRKCCETFGRIHDEAGLSTVAAELADALYLQGLDEEAGEWIDLAQQHVADDDINAQHTWRRVRAKLLARQGAFSEARALGFEAARLAGETDAINDHGKVLLDVAEVLRASGSPAEATGYVQRAVRLFDRKGNAVSAQAARSVLSKLPVA